MSLQTALNHNSQLGGIVCFCGFMNHFNQVKQGSTPALIMHGTEDKVIPYWKAGALYQRLKDLPNKQFVTFPGQDHSISPDMAALFKPFFDKYAKQ